MLQLGEHPDRRSGGSSKWGLIPFGRGGGGSSCAEVFLVETSRVSESLLSRLCSAVRLSLGWRAVSMESCNGGTVGSFRRKKVFVFLCVCVYVHQVVGGGNYGPKVEGSQGEE